MNKMKIKYVLNDDSVVEMFGEYDIKLHCIDLNKIVLLNAPIDTDYIKSISIKIVKDVK